MAASDILRSVLRNFGFDAADETAVFNFLNARVADPTFEPTETTIRFEVGQDPQIQQIFDKRFAGNKVLRERGMAEYSFSEYVELERTLRNTLRSAGLPAGFYDDSASLANFIGQEVSAVELADRAQAAYVAVRSEDPALRAELETMYGVSEGELAAYYLDPNKAMDAMGKRLSGQDLLRRTQAAQIGAEVRSATGVGLSTREAEALQSQGVSREEARQAANEVAQIRGLLQPAQAGEEAIGVAEAIGAQTGVNAAAAQRVATRARRRRAEAEAGGGFAQTNQFLQTGLQTVGQ